MLEDVFIQDMAARGLAVTRNSRFLSCSRIPSSNRLCVSYQDLASSIIKYIQADYLVGCDGARSQVRQTIPGARLEGAKTNESWGVLDGTTKLNQTRTEPLTICRSDRHRLSRSLEQSRCTFPRGRPDSMDPSRAQHDPAVRPAQFD